MKKRELLKRYSVLGLCMLLVLGLLPSAALAVDTFTTSDEGVALIKEFEDFRAMPYEDRGVWYIGYGTSCEPGDYASGISEAEADALLRERLVEFEDAVNKLLMDYGISVNQQQFDAMVDMTYNLGTQWIIPSYRFCGYLISGIWQYSEAEVVNAIGTFCHQGTLVRDSLVSRRLREAYLFLYGEYENSGPDSYRYIDFNANGGKVDHQTVFYPIGQPYGELPEPRQKGRTFMGWFTANGTQITGEDLALENQYVTAKWDGEVSGPAAGGADLSDWVNPYSDVAEKDWYYNHVRELSANGIMGGYPDNTFQADKQLSAGEALKVLLMAAGYQDPGNASEGHWAGNYLTLAEELGCVYQGEIQDLDGGIGRLTISRIAAVALGLEPREGASPFADVDDGYTLTLYEEGILKGTVMSGQRFYYPDNGITRAEACAIVSRINAWEPKEVNDPGKSGYIHYYNYYLPVLKDVPAAPYNKNLFVLDGSKMYYNDPDYTTAWGIDVSSHQGEIDWQKVAAAGVEFAILRVGGRGYGSEGKTYDDAQFEANLAGAKAAGIKVGVYFFSTAITVEEALEEAQIVLDRLQGRSLEYPVIFDWESNDSNYRNSRVDADTVTDSAIAFCETVAQAGYTPMIYISFNVGYRRMDLSRLTDYDFWFPQYAQAPTMYYDFRIWQYTDSGTVPGIEGKVDMDIAFVPYYGETGPATLPEPEADPETEEGEPSEPDMPDEPEIPLAG